MLLKAVWGEGLSCFHRIYTWIISSEFISHFESKTKLSFSVKLCRSICACRCKMITSQGLKDSLGLEGSSGRGCPVQTPAQSRISKGWLPRVRSVSILNTPKDGALWATCPSAQSLLQFKKEKNNKKGHFFCQSVPFTSGPVAGRR